MEILKLIDNKTFIDLIDKNINSNHALDTFLFYFCEIGDLILVKYLMEKYLECNLENKQKSFIIAIQNNHLHILKYFIDTHNINIDFQSEYPLCLSIIHGDFEIIKYILSLNLDKTFSKRKALNKAIENGNLEIFKLLLEFDVIDLSDDNSEEFLILAIKYNQFNIIKYILDNNSIFIYNYYFLNKALYIACEKGNLDIIKYIYNSCFYLNFNFNSIKICIEKTYLDIIKYIFDRYYEDGLNEFLREYSEKILKIVCDIGNYSMMEYFLKTFPELKCNINNEYPLRRCCELGYLDLVQFLIENKNANFHILNEECLYLSSINEHLKILSYLIDKGADYNKRYNEIISKIDIDSSIILYLTIKIYRNIYE